ncbi:GNAT family N-acetyltransferase [Vibrio parahaemolyticus]|uniref:GNAT family N-acetyltransferase n=1 Tax=Vibrio parahaemolyticus TaxID=670 RepID=UPI001DC3CA02|nr:GNAT family N-acetyltransferase [Vibrio parahaemolyticus]EGR2691078.1 GNAT family N-acetyltransferase [Vibrio parahaemolyticus]EGR2706698.1 GNAT family N-acetyltransferase [Vibrio parahaemolyticus]
MINVAFGVCLGFNIDSDKVLVEVIGLMGIEYGVMSNQGGKIEVLEANLSLSLNDINHIRKSVALSESQVLNIDNAKLSSCEYLLLAFFVKDGERIAYCGLRESLIRNIDNPIELDIFVMPNFQKQQIGTQLINRVLEIARPNYAHVTIQVKKSSNLIPFYNSLGFQTYFAGQGATVMKYPLTKYT